MTCKYDNKTEAIKGCDWCGDGLCSFCGYVVDGERACNECYKTISECDHMCSSNCRRDGCNYDCGEYHKDTTGAKKKERGEFSADQERIIRETMKVCEDAGCDGPDHKEHD